MCCMLKERQGLEKLRFLKKQSNTVSFISLEKNLGSLKAQLDVFWSFHGF